MTSPVAPHVGSARNPGLPTHRAWASPERRRKDEAGARNLGRPAPSTAFKSSANGA